MRLAIKETETENLFEILANKSPVGICIIQDGRFCYTNPAFQNTTGYREDELLGRDSLEIVVPEDRERTRENAIKMLKGKLTLPYQFRVTHKSGSIHWVIESVASVQYRGKRATLGSFVDITERKQAEEALQAGKNKLQSLVDAMTDGLNIIDTDYNIIYQNEPSKRPVGGDHTGEKCYRAFEGREKMCDGCPVEKAFKDGKSHTAERKTSISGKVAFWENTANPIRDAAGRIVSCLEIAKDITERKKAEEVLNKTQAQLSSAVQMAHLGPWEYDAINGLFIFNDAFYNLFHTTAEEVGGYTMSSAEYARRFVYPEDAHLVGEEVRKALQADDPNFSRQLDHRIIYADGGVGYISVRFFIIKDETGSTVRTYGVDQDITERKKIEEALREAEEEKSALLEEAPVGIIHANLKGKITYVNKRFESESGYPREEITGKSGLKLDWFPAGTTKYLAKRMAARLRGSPAKCWETQFKCKDGRWIWIELEGKILKRLGVPVGFQIIARNITERKKQEQALKDSEESYRELANSITNVFFAMDEHLRYTYWNRASEILTGIGAEDAIGKSLLEIFPDTPGLRRAEKVYHDVLRTQQPQTFVNDFDIDGRHYTFEISAYPSRGGISVFARDITERKQAEEALQQSKENYRALFDSTAIGMFVLDAETGKTLMVNQAAAKMLGFSSVEEAQKVDPVDFVRPEDTERIFEIAKHNLFEQDSQQTYELPVITKNGREIWINATGAKIMHEGRLASLISFADITEQKNQTEQLMMTNQLASLGELAAGTAHELNNPLTSVIGFSQLLMEKDIPDDIREDLKLINNEAQRAANVTRNLLAFARKHAPVKQLNQINSIIEDVLELRAYEHKVNCIDVERHLALDLPKIMVDYFQIQQVFINIITNAEYFMTEAHNGGILTITTKKQNSTVRISIADNGPGIPPENLKRIFDPFFTTKEVGKGTGLGLSICHGIVAEHGGQIYAKSQLGKGATFVVELPIESP